MKINICHIVINEHKHIFTEISNALRLSLEELGFFVTSSENDFSPDAINIILGHAFCVDLRGLKNTPVRYIVLQLEHLHDNEGFYGRYPYYETLLQNALWVWDFSLENIRFLRSRAVKNVRYLPIGYHTSFTRISQSAEKKIDVLFFGSVSQRRKKILQELERLGYRVEAAFGIYGKERDALISETRVNINIHQFELPGLEVVRLSYLLSNKCFVISEESAPGYFPEGVVCTPYNNLVDTCRHYLLPRNEKERTRIADIGHVRFCQTSYRENLRAVTSDLSDYS